MEKARFYGGDATYHDTTSINVELHEGKVVAVWYRCQALPFTQDDFGKQRAEEMEKLYKEYPMPKVIGVTLKDKK